MELIVLISLFKWEKPKKKDREENWSNLCFVFISLFFTLLPLKRDLNWRQSNLCSKISKGWLGSLLTASNTHTNRKKGIWMLLDLLTFIQNLFNFIFYVNKMALKAFLYFVQDLVVQKKRVQDLFNFFNTL